MIDSLDGLVRGLPHVRHAVLLSADGLVLGHSAGLDTTDAEYLASMAAVLQSLAHRAGSVLDGGDTQHVTVQCDRTALIIVAVNATERLALAGTADADPAEILRHTQGAHG